MFSFIFFLLICDGSFVYYIYVFQLRGQMEEANQVLLRKKLIDLAQRITWYFNHWLFLKVSCVINVAPKGLRLKKSAHIRNTFESFLEKME